MHAHTYTETHTHTHTHTCTHTHKHAPYARHLREEVDGLTGLTAPDLLQFPQLPRVKDLINLLRNLLTHTILCRGLVNSLQSGTPM